MREMSVAEQRYQAVLAVISDGLSVSQLAQKVGVRAHYRNCWLNRELGKSLYNGIMLADVAGGLQTAAERENLCTNLRPIKIWL